MKKLKTLKDLDFPIVTDVRPDGYEGNVPFRKRIVKRKAIFVHILKAEAVKWVKEDMDYIKKCKTGTVEQEMIIMLYEWMKRLNITEDDLK